MVPTESTPKLMKEDVTSVEACTVQGCSCPAFVGQDPNKCIRSGCGHHYHHHVTSANACTVQGCSCPKYVGMDPNCIREGCGHSYQQH
ncbi:hypothetical protein BJV77DRAFT_979981, partial [Russula vinacea]